MTLASQKKNLVIAGIMLSACCFGEPGYPELWFPVGERLTYRIVWGILPIAEAKITSRWVEEEDDEDKRILLAIRVTIRTYQIFDAVYPINDFIESVIEPETFMPVRFSVRLSESSSRLNEITIFNHKNRVAHWEQLDSQSAKDLAIEPDTRDFLSLMFFMRGQKFEPQQTYYYRVMATDKFYDLAISTRDYAGISLPKYGMVRCLELQAKTTFEGFLIKIDQLRVWISDDKRAFCAKGIAKTSIFGRIRVILEKVEGPGNDFWLKR